MGYPTIYLDERNGDIAHCRIIHAFVEHMAHVELNDGTQWSYADIVSYENGVITFDGDYGAQRVRLSYPIVDIKSLTYF